MTLETRLSNLENLVNALSKKIDNNKFYQGADIDGTRKGVSEITPYKESKTAYIDDTEIIFTDIPQGNLSVYVVDADNNYPAYTLERQADRLKVSFEPCENVTTVTISVL